MGAIRNALRQNLPSWAFLGLTFIIGSVLEVITDGRLKQRLVATLRLLGIREIPDLNIYKPAKKKGGLEIRKTPRKNECKNGHQKARGMLLIMRK